MDASPMVISRHVWETKYRYVGPSIAEHSIADTWRRVAHALAAVESSDVPGWERRFFSILQDFKFLPGGRIQAGAGTGHDVTLFNCFVMGPVEDSIPGISARFRKPP
jgi:ribonucleoside-diphosphate reductase alpha chain